MLRAISRASGVLEKKGREREGSKKKAKNIEHTETGKWSYYDFRSWGQTNIIIKGEKMLEEKVTGDALVFPKPYLTTRNRSFWA